MATSYTTILAMRGLDFVLMVGDGQSSAHELRTALRMDSDKTRIPCPRVCIGCSGSLDCRLELMSALEGYDFTECETGEDAANIIIDKINDDHYENWKRAKIDTEILIVTCIDEPRIFRIEKFEGGNGSYYMEEVYDPIVAIGSGEAVLKHWFEFFREEFTPQQAFEFAEKLVPLATKTDWGTGGNLMFNTIYQYYQTNTKYHEDGALYHTHRVSLQQENPRDCNCPYTIRVDTWI